jgi:hypothetical protein
MPGGAARRSFKVDDSSIIILDGRDIGWVEVTEREYERAQLQFAGSASARG